MGPLVPLGKVFVSFPMEDEDDVDPMVRDVAAFVAALVGSGRKVLVHCTEGLNRSGVVIARALMEMGRSAPEAIELVRRGRGPSVDGFPALGNEAFIAWLKAEDRSTGEPALLHERGLDVEPEHLEPQLREGLDVLGPAPRAQLLHVLMLPDLERHP